MIYKILFITIPLTIASVSKLPTGSILDSYINRPNKISSTPLTLKPIDEPSSSVFSIPNSNEDFFSCGTYGPFSLDNPQDFSVTFTYKLYSIASQSIIERLRVFNSANSVVSSSSKATKSYTQGKRVIVTFTFPLRNNWNANGLTLKFEILNSSSYSVLKAYSATFYPPSNSVIPATTLKKNIYTSRSLGFYSDGTQMKEMKETFNFKNFGDYLNVENYYRLDVDKNTFLYPNEYTFTYDEASLYFNDSDNLFPYYTHQVNGDIYIPLKLVRNGNTISLAYNKNFYINKRTLQMSDTYRAGFTLTQDFYLPINGRNKFNGKQIYIDLKKLGLDGISTTMSVRYQADKSIVGNCNDGDYCVVGGKR